MLFPCLLTCLNKDKPVVLKVKTSLKFIKNSMYVCVIPLIKLKNLKKNTYHTPAHVSWCFRVHFTICVLKTY